MVSTATAPEVLVVLTITLPIMQCVCTLLKYCFRSVCNITMINTISLSNTGLTVIVKYSVNETGATFTATM